MIWFDDPIICQAKQNLPLSLGPTFDKKQSTLCIDQKRPISENINRLMFLTLLLFKKKNIFLNIILVTLFKYYENIWEWKCVVKICVIFFKQ